MSNFTDYMSIYTCFFFVCNRLHLITSCLCCFLDMHLYSNNLAAIATISSLTRSEFFPARFSFNTNFSLSQNSSGFSDKNSVEIPEAMIAGDSSYFVRDRSVGFFVLSV